MLCGCPYCGDLMAQVPKGMNSYCICPQCGHTCNACMGTGQSVRAPKVGKLQLSRELREYLEHELDDKA